MRDVVYYFDKLSPYARHELGEIQTDFNTSFTIDGTKDSTKLVVRSFNGKEVEPCTILKHQKTNTWWCVKKDDVRRYANESGFIYVHTIQCNGAKELFNSRDLTDSGYNQRRYTISQFLNRLIKLSNFDFPNISFIFGNNLNQNSFVDYVKTFENYSLLSAMREFLDGYNCDFKLTFDQYANGRLYHAYITIIPKTGNVDLPILDEDEFKDVREIKKIDKNNFGTTVVSNAENVISSVEKVYPSQGSIRLSSTEYTITNENAVLRLPSNVYKMNWVKMFTNGYLTITKGGSNDQYVSVIPNNSSSIDNFISTLKAYVNSNYGSEATSIKNQIDNQINTIIDNLKKACCVTLYDGNTLNPVSGAIVKGENVPYIPTFLTNNGDVERKLIITDKNQRNCLPHKEEGIYWERGSDLIQGFDILRGNRGAEINLQNISTSNDLQGTNVLTISSSQGNLSVGLRAFAVVDDIPIYLRFTTRLASFVINYIPMSDIKIKIDNQRSTKDIQLYNQNGRLVDSVALSKLLNSYSREISSDKITKYGTYYNFDDIPKAGQMVNINNELYVINNVSIDFFANENDSYYMPCEFNLCKYVSTKSLMVNPNTNIRDYGIPQNFNVKRKQLYRDYLEFEYTLDPNADGTFYSNDIPFNIKCPVNLLGVKQESGYEPKSHKVVIRCEYQNQVDNSYYWYYQLETTIYRLDKLHIELLDFKDNNIIGYDSQNTNSNFEISRIMTGLLDTINTPISYVDENGEVKGIDLRFANNEQIANVWNSYKIEQGYGSDTNYDLTNFSCIVPSDIYTKLANNCDIEIVENDYEKDATEVPVFEYVFQVGDSDSVLIGDKILNNIIKPEDEGLGFIWLYAYVEKDAGTLNQINASKYMEEIYDTGSIGYLDNATLTIEYPYATPSDPQYNAIDFMLFEDVMFSVINYNGLTYQNVRVPSDTKDYAIYRVKYSTLLNTQFDEPELVMVLKNVPPSAIVSIGGNKAIRIYKNKYKLK